MVYVFIRVENWSHRDLLYKMILHKTYWTRWLHKTKREKKDFTLQYKRYAKGKYMSPTGTNRTNKETNDKGLTNTQSPCKVLKFKKKNG